MYALDTNTLIYFFKGMGNVARYLLDESPKDIAVPAIVLFELAVRISKSAAPEKRRAQLAYLLSAIRVLPFGIKEARSSAQLRADLEKAGTPIGPYDTLIAGTALAHGATLITRNTREFSRVRNLPLADWYA